MTGPHTFAMEFVAGLLREDARLAGAGVEVILQNDGDLATLIERETKSLDAPVAVVTVVPATTALDSNGAVRVAAMAVAGLSSFATPWRPMNSSNRSVVGVRI